MAKQARRTEQRALSVAEILSKPYARVLVPDSNGFRAEILEFPGCLAEGDTAADAYEALEAAAGSWIEASLESGVSIPEPSENCQFSGKLVLRLPKSLHKKASVAAERDGTSLNQFIVSSIAYQCGTRSGPVGQAQVIMFHASFPTVPHRGTWVNIGMEPAYTSQYLTNPIQEYANAGS